MLIYDYALDPYHCAIRILTICTYGNAEKRLFQVDSVRILDYFLVYPSKLASSRLPLEHKSIRKQVRDIENPYRHSPGKRAAFERMKSIFHAASSGLGAAGMIDIDLLERGILKLNPNNIPPEMESAVHRFKARQSTVGNFILAVLSAYPVNGADGLKNRSGLLEYRYDIA
jgi:hypothetical protein